MAKFYAVRTGHNPGVYLTWDECKNQVSGFPGASYKSFKTQDEAEKFIYCEETSGGEPDNKVDVDINSKIDEDIKNLKIDEVIAFVDGSCKENKYDGKLTIGFGAIVFSGGERQDTLYKSFNENYIEGITKHRNVAAELLGAQEVINWAIKNGKRKITIFYDYEGIEKWAIGKWNAGKAITKEYVAFISQSRRNIEIDFVKVKAHDGILYNDEVDSLAKKALLKKGHKSYNDGSVYFSGYSTNEWKSIIEIINEENYSMGIYNEIKFIVETNVKSTRIEILNANDKVIINCYNNPNNSYVQGKSSSLFEKVVSTAVTLAGSNQEFVERLNSFRALNLTEIEVIVKFEDYLPLYKGDRDGKFYRTLLSSVYNTMLTGYMPDYTCLVTPIFRVYENYLHNILGGKMGLPTTTTKGNNKFAYFNTDPTTGAYFCTSKNVSILTPDQLDYLNGLYNCYHRVRHPYSHWSSSEVATAVITEISDARDYIEEGLTIANNYYKLF